MRLLNAKTLQLELFPDPAHVRDATPYAILSHTWETDEVTLDDMKDLEVAKSKAGFGKIQSACKTTIDHNLSHIWIDTCCIDKSSSAELSEAINSMFNWYRRATVCLAFLADFPNGAAIDKQLPLCRWFTRGWTLQELIAPKNLLFFDDGWNLIGAKAQLGVKIQVITGISQQILVGSEPHSSAPLAKRMFWAAKRQTTRVEDKAYCLLGIFDVNMPMIYGEGSRAFFRLQEEILRKTTDLSIFAWRMQTYLSGRGFVDGRRNWPDSDEGEEIGVDRCVSVLAESPADFWACSHITLNEDQFQFRDEISPTNRGIKIQASLEFTGDSNYTMDLHCYNAPPNSGETRRLGILLKRVMDTYVRRMPYRTATVRSQAHDTLPRPILLACTASQVPMPPSLVQTTRHNSISFEFKDSKDRKLSFVQEELRGVPETYWEDRSRKFSLGGISRFICFVCFQIEHPPPANNDSGSDTNSIVEGIIICAMGGSPNPNFCMKLYTRKEFERSPKRNPKFVINPFTDVEKYGPAGHQPSLERLKCSLTPKDAYKHPQTVRFGGEQKYAIMAKANEDHGAPVVVISLHREDPLSTVK